MNKLLSFIFQEIASVFFSEGVTALKENADQKKRKENLEKGLKQIIESEQDNLYYDDLIRVLMNSHYIQDLIKGYKTGNPGINDENRINDIIAHEHVKEESRSSVIGVIERMKACIEDVMQKPSSNAEIREAYRHKQTQNMFEDFKMEIGRKNLKLKRIRYLFLKLRATVNLSRMYLKQFIAN